MHGKFLLGDSNTKGESMDIFLKAINVLGMVICVGFIWTNTPSLEPRSVSDERITFSNQESTFLYFGADWCIPCRQMKELFKDTDVKKELDKLDFTMYNVDVDKDEARRWKVKVVPTMIFIDLEGNVEKITGSKSKTKLIEILKKYSSPT